MTANEDFLFAQEALAQGFVTDAQVQEALLLQKRMADELKIDERVGVILVKRGWLAEDQARRVHARITPSRGEPGEIHGYRLLEIVGRGAMGTVYRAIHTGLNRTVAIKILRQDLAGDRTQVERLKAEAAMLASLDHPNIVRALDAGESNGFPYVVMEFVDGETLRDRMRREGPLPESVALQIARGIADALERARRMGVVHRDVKPGNVLMTRAGVPKLMDLGLAKGPVDLGLTQHGSTVGTPQYIAPEQAVDPRSADTRSDIYALGATLYAMLTGRPPFDGQTLAEILTKVLYEVPLPVRTLRPGVSAEAGYLVERMMMRDPSLRYQTPALVVADIDKLTGGNSILPKGFSGNWEAYLLKRRWRRISIVVPSTVAAAVALAFAIHGYRSRSEGADARTRVEQALLRHPPYVPDADTRVDVARRLAEVRTLLVTARAYDSISAGEYARRVAEYEIELGRFDALATAEAKAAELEAGGRYREAHDALVAAGARIRGGGPALRALGRAIATVRERSDRALLDARRAAFAVPPRDITDLSTSLDAWLSALDDRYVRATPIANDERATAVPAVDAARDVAQAIASGVHALADERIGERVAGLQLAELRGDVAAARARLQRVRMTTAEDSLRKPRYVGVEALAALLDEPIDARVRALETAVDVAFGVAQAEARAAAARGDPGAALAIYERFAAAAAEGEAFPNHAAAAKAARDELALRAQTAMQRAETAVRDLAAVVASDLMRRDIVAVAARLEAAHARSDVFAPLAPLLETFAPIPAAWDRLYERATAALSSYAVPSPTPKERRIDRIAFVGAADPEKLVEIRGVDAARRTFSYISHRGGFARPEQTRAVADLAIDDLERLSGLTLDVPADALTLALHAFPRLAEFSDDPGVRLDAHRAVRDRFERAGALESPLARHVHRATAELEARVKSLEARATDSYETAERAFSRGQYAEANGVYLELLRPPYKFARVVGEHRDRILEKLSRIRGELKRGVVVLAFNGARVERNGSGASDGLDVSVTHTFDTPEQLRNFSAGWARLVNPAGVRVVTPDATVVDQSLLLLPDSVGEIVRDRPLVLPTFLDPTAEMSMSFRLWPRAPFFLALDLDGVQVGVLSADPQEIAFPPDVPRLDPKEEPPRFNHYGRGRGVRFRLGSDFGDPAKWGWSEENQGRRFVPPQLAKRPKDLLATKWFAFENREREYRVRFVRIPGRGARLEIDGVTVAEDSGEAYKSVRPSGKLQILSYSPCLIDDLELTGRVSVGWLEAMTKIQVPGAVPETPAGTGVVPGRNK